jgi:sugar phosphate isomerase/epimerase
MGTDRRTFLKTSAIAAAGAALLSRPLIAGIPDFRGSAAVAGVLSIQLYSIREAMLKDPLGSLTQIAKMGYKNVEHANYIDRKFYGYSAVDFKKVLLGLGLAMPSGHTVMGKNHWDESKNDFTDSWKYTVEDAATLGQKFVISPWLDESMRKTFDGFKRYMEVFNKSGELCQKSGMKFGYHNHDFEFTVKLNDQKLFDLIMQNTDPNLVAQQLDIGNMYHAGGRAIDILKQYPNRFELLHVKDEISLGENKYESTILGTGIVHTKEICDLSRQLGGTKYFVIEQESYQTKDPLDCVKEDLEIMKQWGYNF